MTNQTALHNFSQVNQIDEILWSNPGCVSSAIEALVNLKLASILSNDDFPSVVSSKTRRLAICAAFANKLFQAKILRIYIYESFASKHQEINLNWTR